MRRTKQIGLGVALLYLIGVHGLVYMSLFAPHMLDAQRWRSSLIERPSDWLADILLPYHQAIDEQVSTPRTVIIGDSHCHRFDSASLAHDVLNYCIGGNLLSNLPDQMSMLNSVRTAQTLIIWAGVNDILQDVSTSEVANALDQVINASSGAKTLIVLSIPPLGEGFASHAQKVIETNEAFSSACRERCVFVPLAPHLADSSGTLYPLYDSGDGLHLNALGYAIVKAQIAPLLDALTE